MRAFDTGGRGAPDQIAADPSSTLLSPGAHRIRSRELASPVYGLQHGVTHYCGAPIVHSLLVNAPDELKKDLPRGVKAMVAGAVPPASMIEGMERLGFDLTHVYGRTEVYGPETVCPKHHDWDGLDIGERARLNVARACATTCSRAQP